MTTEHPNFRVGALVAGGLLLSALLILWLGNGTNIDLVLADAAFDRLTGTFPLRHAWLAERFNHGILKSGLVALGIASVLLALWDVWRPRVAWPASRRTGTRVVAMSAVLVPLATSVLKRLSTSHCPWDLERYGGTAPYIRLLDWMPTGVAPGHCLPAGHASSALWLVALAAFWWPHSKWKAIVVGFVMLFLGGAVGWLQQLRGAHFLSHTLWSAWIACAVVSVVYLLNVKGLAWLRGVGYNSVPAATQP